MSGVVLVVDDSLTNLKVLTSKLESEYYTVIQASGGKEALKQLEEHNIDIVLLDVMMPEMDGYEVCKLIKSNYKSADIPIIMVTALDDVENRVKGLSIGADEFLTKPINDTALYIRVRSLLRLKKMIDGLKLHNKSLEVLGALKQSDIYLDLSSFKILAIVSNDDSNVEEEIHNALDAKMPGVEYVQYSGSLNYDSKYDLVIIEHKLAGADAFDVFRRMHNSSNFRDTTFVLVVEESDIQVVDRAIEIGFDDFIVYPIDKTEFLVRVQSLLKRVAYQNELRKDLSEYVDLSVRDPLTKLFNKRYLEVYLDQLIRKSETNDKALYLLMIDIDDFKSINDTWGHTRGDHVLVEISKILASNLRASDFVGRYGGEEFICIIYDVNEIEIKDIASRLVSAVNTHDFGLVDKNSNGRKVTVSLGVCKYVVGTSRIDFITCADQAMYHIKNTGKNNYYFCHHASF